jgi:hypothetical protein
VAHPDQCPGGKIQPISAGARSILRKIAANSYNLGHLNNRSHEACDGGKESMFAAVRKV